MGRFGREGFGVGEQSVDIILETGACVDALELIQRIFDKLKGVLK